MRVAILLDAEISDILVPNRDLPVGSNDLDAKQVLHELQGRYQWLIDSMIPKNNGSDCPGKTDENQPCS